MIRLFESRHRAEGEAAGVGAVRATPSDTELAAGPQPALSIAIRALDLNRTRVHRCEVEAASRLIVHLDPRSPATDRFRFLRMRLRELKVASGLSRILVTSPLPGDGKTTMALNLATVLAEHGDRTVLLIDADLHHGSVAKRLGLKAAPGVAECLAGTADPSAAMVRIEPLNWYLLAAGDAPAQPTEVLQSSALPRLIQQLSPHFDWIVMDSPPVLPITDALSLARQANSTLLVARAGQTPVEAIQKCVALLGSQNVLGVLLNGVDQDQRRLYSGYHSYYSESRSKPS